MQCWKVIPAVFGVLATMPVVAVAADQASPAAPASFRVVSDTVDVGDVIAGRTGVARFEFRNDGDVDVRILRAAPS